MCDRPSRIIPYIEKCSFDWAQGHDSTTSFLEGWVSVPDNHSESRNNDPWAYKTTMDVNGVPYAGEVTIYAN